MLQDLYPGSPVSPKQVVAGLLDYPCKVIHEPANGQSLVFLGMLIYFETKRHVMLRGLKHMNARYEGFADSPEQAFSVALTIPCTLLW